MAFTEVIIVNIAKYLLFIQALKGSKERELLLQPELTSPEINNFISPNRKWHRNDKISNK